MKLEMPMRADAEIFGLLNMGTLALPGRSKREARW
jgi:hypothetical protein